LLLEKSLAHRLSQRRWSVAQAAVHRAHEAALRLARILDKNRPVATRVWKPALGMVGAFSMVCFAVLPHAPQFVAFDRGASASNSGHVYSVAVRLPPSQSFHSSLQTAAAIPAALRTGESSSVATTAKGTTAKVVRARVYAHDVAGRQLAPARKRVVEASTSADQEGAPELRTLVFIEATQYTTSDSSVWNVQVWRMTFVSAASERLVGVPVANSI